MDVYFDSPFPTLAVQEIADSEVILRRWKEEVPTYWSVYVANRGSGISTVEGFVGKVIAFEEPYSTSGFLLPAGTLVSRGFKLREVEGPDTEVAADEIGYFFSGDEENTMELILQNKIAGGAASNADYDELTEPFKEQIISFDKTMIVARQLVSARPGLDPDLVEAVRKLLVGLWEHDEGREILEALSKTVKFDRLPPDAEVWLAELTEFMRVLPR